MDKTYLNETAVHTHGVTQKRVNASELDVHVEEVSRNGFTILRNVLSQEELSYFSAQIDAIYQQQVEEIGGEENLERCDDKNNVRSILVYDHEFVKLAAHERVIELAQAVLGANLILLMQNGIINNPDDQQHQVSWHRDLNYQHWVTTEPLAINALYCIDPFRVENGCTVAMPGSHQHIDFPSDEYVRKHEVPLEANAGDVVIMDSMMYHRAGFNKSNEKRRAVNNVIAKPFMAQQLDLSTMLQGKFADDPFLSKFLGYKWSPPSDVVAWRKARYRN